MVESKLVYVISGFRTIDQLSFQFRMQDVLKPQVISTFFTALNNKSSVTRTPMVHYRLNSFLSPWGILMIAQEENKINIYEY